MCRPLIDENLNDLTVASPHYDILLSSDISVSDMHHVHVGVDGSRIRSPGLVVPWGKMPRARGMAAHAQEGYGAFRQPKF